MIETKDDTAVLRHIDSSGCSPYSIHNIALEANVPLGNILLCSRVLAQNFQVKVLLKWKKKGCFELNYQIRLRKSHNGRTRANGLTLLEA